MILENTNISTIKINTDSRGDLLEIDFSKLEFIPKRIFVVKGVPEAKVRGNHAHFKTHQYLVCLGGLLNISLDNGFNKKKFTLKKGECILQRPLHWAIVEFNNDASLLVVSSTPHDEADYIRNYEEFIKEVKHERN